MIDTGLHVYIAGRISKNDWRREIDAIVDPNAISDSEGKDHLLACGFPIVDAEVDGFTYHCTGPFFVRCDHGCAHGRNSHGVDASNASGCLSGSSYSDSKGHARASARCATVHACLSAIDRSDLVFAWLTEGAYGTMLEIGYALAKNKQVVVAGPATEWDSDLWFAASSNAHVLSFEHLPTPKEALVAALKVYSKEVDPASICESPIEVMFWKAVARYTEFIQTPDGICADFRTFKVFPQLHVDRYRLDFAFITDDGRRVDVELDGHDFHERTKEQAERDKTRDRELQKQGWVVFRYTGSQVYRDPVKVAHEVFRFLDPGANNLTP